MKGKTRMQELIEEAVKEAKKDPRSYLSRLERELKKSWTATPPE